MSAATSPVLVIAEAGVNHNGSVERALAMIDAAAAAGADFVKFQTFRAAELASSRAPKAAYQLAHTDATQSQLDMLRQLELSQADHEALRAHAAHRQIGFLSTPFDLPSLRLLTQRLGLQLLKVPSGEITNGPFLLELARTGRDLIVSTGMSSLAEVETALAVLAFGYTEAGAGGAPGLEAFASAYASAAGRGALRQKVRLLHCTSEYPAPFAEVNLLAMHTLATAFGLPVGLSDHTSGTHIALAAVARGACIIEKHFTLDRALPGPDHAASLEPPELALMVRNIREVESALGEAVKRPTASEARNRAVARKHLVATRRIAAGEKFSRDNVGAKRCGAGLSPMEYWSVLGRVAARDFEPDDPISL
jgi:N-acetylneuraminate synthase